MALWSLSRLFNWRGLLRCTVISRHQTWPAELQRYRRQYFFFLDFFLATIVDILTKIWFSALTFHLLHRCSFSLISSPSRIWIPLSDSLNSTTGISKEKLCMISISNIPLLKTFFVIWYDLLLWQSLRLLNIGSIALVATNKRFFISDAKSFQRLSFRTSIASCHPVAR